MSALRKPDLISYEDYLAGEIESPIKHEYLAGRVYAMAGGTNAHNGIASNTLIALGIHLDGKKCRPYNSDTKVRIPEGNDFLFYYPDAMVVCEQNPPGDTFQDRPVFLLEVVSPSSERADDRENKGAYFTIPTLQNYLVIDSRTKVAIHYSRDDRVAGGFRREILEGDDAVVQLPYLGCELPFHKIYQGITLAD